MSKVFVEAMRIRANVFNNHCGYIAIANVECSFDSGKVT